MQLEAAALSQRRATEMAELLFIVARERRDLYDHLRRAFADTPAVEVILDRRVGDERRQQPLPQENEQRHRERRVRDVTGDVQSLGWALVRLRPRR
jgi:hypothetical protein